MYADLGSRDGSGPPSMALCKTCRPLSAGRNVIRPQAIEAHSRRRPMCARSSLPLSPASMGVIQHAIGTPPLMRPNTLKQLGNLMVGRGPDRRRSGPRQFFCFVSYFNGLTRIRGGVSIGCRITQAGAARRDRRIFSAAGDEAGQGRRHHRLCRIPSHSTCCTALATNIVGFRLRVRLESQTERAIRRVSSMTEAA